MVGTEIDTWLSIGTRDLAILSRKSSISSPDPSPSFHHTDLDKFVTINESEISEISPEEVSDESAFTEAPEPELEPAVKEDCDVEAGARPIDDDWGYHRR